MEILSYVYEFTDLYVVHNYLYVYICFPNIFIHLSGAIKKNTCPQWNEVFFDSS